MPINYLWIMILTGQAALMRLDEAELKAVLDTMGIDASDKDGKWFEDICEKYDKDSSKEFEFDEFVSVYLTPQIQ